MQELPLGRNMIKGFILPIIILISLLCLSLYLSGKSKAPSLVENPDWISTENILWGISLVMFFVIVFDLLLT